MVLTTVHLLLFQVVLVFGGWIDPDSSELAPNTLDSLVDGSAFNLVFSDEFNTEGRSFDDGSDPRWTAINKNDYTNYALHYYNKKLAKTSRGYLNISTVVEDIEFEIKHDGNKKPYMKKKNYQSGMIQGWNKFCFTGGIVEISAKLPGRWDIGGLWPAMWLLGNLARATYVGSSNNVWPWSYDSCDYKFQEEQLISACNYVNHYGMESRHGRGAPEVDILEAMPGKEKLINTPINKPYYSASYQVSPGRIDYRPVTAQRPDPNSSWYDHDIEYGANTSLNIFFYGMSLSGEREEESYIADAVSANRNISETHFDDFHKYRLEWKAGPEGYLKWFLDDEFVYSIDAKALSHTGALIPEEPMYLIFNTAISSTWGFPVPCPDNCDCHCFDCRDPECLCGIPWNMCDNLPADFLIDYVRVYQNAQDDSQIVGCSTLTHPTKTYIEGNAAKFMTSEDKVPLQPIAVGGAKCTTSDDCGSGQCQHHRCKCDKGFVGPTCLASNGFDDIIWDVTPPLPIHGMYIPRSLLTSVLVIATIFALMTGVTYWYKSSAHGQDGYQSVEMTDRRASSSSYQNS